MIILFSGKALLLNIISKRVELLYFCARISVSHIGIDERKGRIMFRTEYVKNVYAELQKNNANEPEFLQAAQEILESLELIVEKRPEIEEFSFMMGKGCRNYSL